MNNPRPLGDFWTSLEKISDNCVVRIHFIVHGGRAKALNTANYLAEHLPSTHEAVFFKTVSKEGLAELIEQARHEAELLAIIGGDGLFSLTVKFLLLHSGPMPAVALIPSGSGNDFARNFGWISSPLQFLDRLQRAQFTALDCGEILSARHRDIFTNETSTGISNAVVRLVEKKPVSWNGNLKFGLSILQAFATFRKRECEISWEGGSWSGKAMLVACCNGKYFGSGIGIAPDAQPGDGFLELVIIGNISIFHYLRFLPRLRKGLKIDHPEVQYVRTSRIQINAEGSLERDGEPGVELPAEIGILPGCLRVLM